MTKLTFGQKKTETTKLNIKPQIVKNIEAGINLVVNFNKGLDIIGYIVPAHTKKGSMEFGGAGSFDTSFTGLSVRQSEQAKAENKGRDLYAEAFQGAQACNLAKKHGSIEIWADVVDTDLVLDGAQALITINEKGITAKVDDLEIPVRAGATAFCATQTTIDPIKRAEMLAKAEAEAKINHDTAEAESIEDALAGV